MIAKFLILLSITFTIFASLILINSKKDNKNYSVAEQKQPITVENSSGVMIAETYLFGKDGTKDFGLVKFFLSNTEIKAEITASINDHNSDQLSAFIVCADAKIPLGNLDNVGGNDYLTIYLVQNINPKSHPLIEVIENNQKSDGQDKIILEGRF